MIDISFWEICLVFIVALLIIGPKRLPKIAHSIGQTLTKLRYAWENLQKQTKQQFDEDPPPKQKTSESDHK